MIILHDPTTLDHETVELLGARTIPALESPARIKAIVADVLESDHVLQYVRFDPDPSSLEILLRLIEQTHESDYLAHLANAFKDWRTAELIGPSDSILPECFVFSNRARRQPAQPPKDIYARAGFFAFDMSTGIMDRTYTSTLASANLAVEAVHKLTDGQSNEVMALCRPPGHHCDGHRAGGYCYVNNAAVAISTWRQKSPNARTGILDIDFHHGNGTQEIFYSDPLVFYTSIHGEDEFPYYTGMADETGIGEATGTNLNLPLKTGSSFQQYMEKLDHALSALVAFSPEFLIVSLGFDTFHLDPLGHFKIDTEDYETIARAVRQRLAGIPAVILLEGGYVAERLGTNVLSFLAGWEGKNSS